MCSTAIPIIIEGRFQVFQRFSRSKLVLKAVESSFVALNYYGNGSINKNNLPGQNEVLTKKQIQKKQSVRQYGTH
jgi:hypothetical protein